MHPSEMNRGTRLNVVHFEFRLHGGYRNSARSFERIPTMDRKNELTKEGKHAEHNSCGRSDDCQGVDPDHF